MIPQPPARQTTRHSGSAGANLRVLDSSKGYQSMRTHRSFGVVALWLFAISVTCSAEEAGEAGYGTRTAISYYDEQTLAAADDYQRERCKLDVYYPLGKRKFATVVWFHGGGLEGGERGFPANLKEQGVALVAVGYRLAPKAQLPNFLEDSAAAVAWVLRNVASLGGDPRRVFVAGHSAGAYLAMMVGMDPQWLAARGLSHRQLAGIIAISGQASTHFKVKELQGDRGHALRPIIDAYAPLYHAAAELPPVCLIVGDRRIEWPSRVEENELLAVTLRQLGHKQVEFYEMGGLDHDTVEAGGQLVAQACIENTLKARR